MTTECGLACWTGICPNLVSALLQQSLYKFPIGMSNDRRGEVGQFGLPDRGSKVPGLLDVLLMTEVERVRQHRIMRNRKIKKY